MECSKHKNYKGLVEPKRDCEICRLIFEEVKKKTINLGKYKSLTTPEMKCGIVHILSEFACIMLFGPQPKYFWRKATLANQDAKDHYAKIYKDLSSWRNTKPEIFNSIETVLFYIYTKPAKRSIFEKSKFTTESKEIKQEEVKIDNNNINDFVSNLKTTNNKWNNLNNLKGDMNGEKEE